MSNKDSINWLEYNQESLKAAKEQNKPIFINLFEKNCRVCEMMDQKVFSNPQCIKILNENFINIKIDTNKRADAKRYFQRLHLLINNAPVTLPISVFATPQNKPFFAGAYISLESQEGSIEGMGILELAQMISHKVKHNDKELYKNADDVEEFLNKANHPKQATKLDKNFTKIFLSQVKENFDTKNGGFFKSVKFPHPNILKALIQIEDEDQENIRNIVQTTLDNMYKNSFFDNKEGGFYRYCNDSKWSHPSGDKTVYDNALLCEVYTLAYKKYKDENYLNIAKRCADFILKTPTNMPYSAMVSSALLAIGKFDKYYLQEGLANVEKKQETNYLQDYAFLAKSYLDAHEHTKDELFLIEAQRVTNEAIARFFKNGVWYFSDNDFKTKANPQDNTYTSEISVMIQNMLKISILLEDKKYQHFAFETLQYNSYELARKPIYHPSMLIEMIKYLMV